MTDDLTGDNTKAFWKNMIDRHPAERGDGAPTGEGTRWHQLDDLGLIISLTVGETGARAFIRGPASAKPSTVAKRLAPAQQAVETALGVAMPSTEHGLFFVDRLAIDLRRRENWDAAADWLFERAQTYEAALNDNLRKSR